MSTKARVIALYLPQFHPTPENDKYWGKGFTEWTNVAKAKPLFKGHYQPRIPADLGFYDLRLPIIRNKQAELAKAAGIEGFMYWHYWFGNGKMTLEKPAEEMLASGEPDYPFCFGWANHDWSNKTWKKSKSFQKDEMIFEMKYSDEDTIAHFNYCLPFFKDKRYITVDGKPLFVIWAAKDIPDVKNFLKIWRDLARENGLKGIHFVALRYGSDKEEEFLNMGFDAINNVNLKEAEDLALQNILLKKIRSAFVRMTGGVVLRKFKYANIAKNLCNKELDSKEYVYPSIISGYDRSARAGRLATIYYDFTPTTFEPHVKEIVNVVKNKDDEHKIIFLKSWNEWAEGNYVEPDLKYGHGFLDVLRKYLVE